MADAAIVRALRAGGRSLRPRRRTGPAAALALLLAGSLCLSGCTGGAVGGGGAVAVEVVKERSLGDAVDDLAIRADLNRLFLWETFELYRDVSFSVIEGRVLLTGSVPTPEDRIQAQRLAWQAGGVREVINELQVTDDSGILNYARDTWISTQLKAKLVFDGDVQSLNYSVETVNGTVYLMGIARNDDELARVIDYARNIDDVKRIVAHVVAKDDPRRPATP